MPRKEIFNKNALLERTYDFIKENGIEKMNARDLCKYIGCSTQPLFRVFGSMEEFKKELKVYLHNFYDTFIDKIVDKENYLYTISYAYALFSLEESNIFKALFMTDLAGTRTIKEVLESSHNIETIKSIPVQYKITEEEANNLYRDIRFYTHGLSCQIAGKTISVSKKEIGELIQNQINKLV